MNITLQKKLNELDPWFDELIDRAFEKDAKLDIHAVEWHPTFGTVVIWSDEKGYTYSYYNNSGQGVSGAFETLTKCVKVLMNYEEKS